MSLSEFKGDLIFPGPAGAKKEDPSDSGEALLLLQAAVLLRTTSPSTGARRNCTAVFCIASANLDSEL